MSTTTSRPFRYQAETCSVMRHDPERKGGEQPHRADGERPRGALAAPHRSPQRLREYKKIQ
jgi:hypothetical protein